MGTSKSGTVGVWLDAEITAEIDRRAEAISQTRSGYAALILKWWQEQGFPPVTKADAALQALALGVAAEDKGTYDAGKPPRKRAS